MEPRLAMMGTILFFRLLLLLGVEQVEQTERNPVVMVGQVVVLAKILAALIVVVLEIPPPLHQVKVMMVVIH
jgi:hypothetical protein